MQQRIYPSFINSTRLNKRSHCSSSSNPGHWVPIASPLHNSFPATQNRYPQLSDSEPPVVLSCNRTIRTRVKSNISIFSYTIIYFLNYQIFTLPKKRRFNIRDFEPMHLGLNLYHFEEWGKVLFPLYNNVPYRHLLSHSRYYIQPS